MPGLVGLITKMPRGWAEPQLLLMVEALRHEPFYETGTWINESLGVYVGWTAQKNSFSDNMPLSNERGDVVLVFSGEEYPEPGTARRLKERGHDLKAKNSSYLVHLYEEDPSFLRSLNGRFHGLLIDRTQEGARLFNDRYGMHRIYYHESKQAFYFAAEAKRFSRSVPSSGMWTLGAWGSSSPVAVSWRTGRSSKMSMCCHLLPPGSFGMAQLNKKLTISDRAIGRTKLRWSRNPTTRSSEEFSPRTFHDISTVGRGLRCP